MQCNNHTYPERAYRCDRAKVVYGSLENGVTATTQPDEDNSQKIATTEYVMTRVQNEIKSQINYEYAEINIGSGTTIRLARKAGYVIGLCVYTDADKDDGVTHGNDTITFNLPDGFAPYRDTYFLVSLGSAANPNSVGYFCTISAGNLNVSGTIMSSINGTNSVLGYAFGWSTNTGLA